MNAAQQTPEAARHDLSLYGRALRNGDHDSAIFIERRWGLFGYSPEIVSTVLSCVATGLALEAAIDEATA